MSKALKAIGFLAFILLFTLAPLGFVLGAKMLKGDLACRIAFGIIAFALIVIGKVSIFASEAFIAGWFIVAAYFLALLVVWGGAIIAALHIFLYPKMTMKYHTSIHQKAKIHK